MNGLPEMFDPADAEPRVRYEDHDRDLRDEGDEIDSHRFREMMQELCYRSYKANRSMCPGRDPQSFARFYPGCDVEAFERRYQEGK